MTDNQDTPKYATGGPINPGRTYWIGEHGPEPYTVPEGFTLWQRDANGGWFQTWPPPTPPKRAWWEYRWPPFVLALLALIAGITSIVMSLGG